MKTFELTKTQVINSSMDNVFDFFSKPENLKAITPEKLSFKILTPTPITMGKGTVIDYTITGSWGFSGSSWTYDHSQLFLMALDTPGATSVTYNVGAQRVDSSGGTLEILSGNPFSFNSGFLDLNSVPYFSLMMLESLCHKSSTPGSAN